MYMKKNINLSLEPKIYQEIKSTVPVGQISPLVNNLLKDYLKRQKEQELALAYQGFAKNKQVNKELEIWQEAVGDGIDKNE